MDSISDLEIGKIRAGEYLIEGFRVYRCPCGDCGQWVVKGDASPTQAHRCGTLRDAKALIVDHLNGVRVIR